MTILVTGARGHVGRAVLDALVAAGQDVRASSRDATTLDVPAATVSADLEDASTLDAALDGVSSVFLYTRPQGIDGFVKAGITRINKQPGREGIGCVLVERGTPGFTVTSRYHTMAGENWYGARSKLMKFPATTSTSSRNHTSERWQKN